MDSVLRSVLNLPLTSIDPVQNTSATIRHHGYLVYGQLYGLDSKGIPQPPMVESHTVSADGMTWRFTLREGVASHDGSPVRAADAV